MTGHHSRTAAVPGIVRFALAVILTALVPLGSDAATYVVGTDRELVAHAGAAVSGTVMSTHCEIAPSGMIRTIALVAVEEDFRGNVGLGAIRVAAWGGRVGGTMMVQSGAPRFTPGERVLLLLDRDRDGEWTTTDLSLGKFTFVEDRGGRSFLVRSSEISGWDESSRPHVERARPAEAFAQFVRDVLDGSVTEEFCQTEVTAQELEPAAASDSAPTYRGAQYAYVFSTDAAALRRLAADYAIDWHLWTGNGTPPGLNFEGAATGGTAAWTTATSSVINLTVSPEPATESTTRAENAESRIVALDPNNVVNGSCCPGTIATTFAYCSGARCDYFTYDGDVYLPLTHVDIIVNNGISSSNMGQGNFNTAITHELGHTLGIRHSDKSVDNKDACIAPLPCCIFGQGCRALMNSSIVTGLTSLQTWDTNAVQCMYNAICPTCPLPAFVQPKNVTIAAFSSTTLVVSVSSPTKARYQWYAGAKGDMSNPVGTDSPFYATGSLAGSAVYWVKVTNDCGSKSSETVEVTVSDRRRVARSR